MTVTVATLGERALRRLGIAVVQAENRPALSVVVSVADIATRALIWLAVIASDESPSALDQALAVSKVQAVNDSLIAQGIVSWASTAIPQSISEEMVMLTVLHLGPAFGKTGDPSQQPVIEARIRRVAMLIGAPDLATQEVMAVHTDLAARGKTRWSVFDIPVAVEDAYTYLAAYRLAPQFAQKPNDADAMMAAQAINRYIALAASGEPVQADYF